MQKKFIFSELLPRAISKWMTKLFVILFASSSISAFAVQTKKCEDVGMKTIVNHIEIQTSAGAVAIGEPQEFCVLREREMISVILASTLLSDTPSLASTAYRNAPKPTVEVSGLRADRAYCNSLGGTYQFGRKILNGGWYDKDKKDGANGMCVFADGSMIATWTLFYKRYNPESLDRPDLEPFFQNPLIPHNLW